MTTQWEYICFSVKSHTSLYWKQRFSIFKLLTVYVIFHPYWEKSRNILYLASVFYYMFNLLFRLAFLFCVWWRANYMETTEASASLVGTLCDFVSGFSRIYELE